MVTPGGETAFVTRMIDESEQLRTRCQWYTTMLGKFSSVGVVVEELKKRGVSNWAVKEFVQGEKTRRWGVGWSWDHRRPREVRILKNLRIGRMSNIVYQRALMCLGRIRMSLEVSLHRCQSIYYRSLPNSSSRFLPHRSILLGRRYICCWVVWICDGSIGLKSRRAWVLRGRMFGHARRGDRRREKYQRGRVMLKMKVWGRRRSGSGSN